ncbi:type II toxin-antitoxin system VapC family toxin [Phycicoccus avicenniae]|uniref:type II toxin-antitoxin system VapC family toxin n=1 Tax=Phycicoccus avicenniae TaxID=2828860 RepID=UPI003D29561F
MAIIGGEPERDAFIEAIRSAHHARMSAGSLLEAGIVVDSRRSPAVSRMFDDLVRELQIDVVPVTEAHVGLGRAAYRDYGRGSGHPAGLSFGDCFAYALARETGEPLLFKGEDFGHTDLTRAIAR